MSFDTHTYVKELRSVGFSEEQAEVQANTLRKLIESDLATKRDLKELENTLRRDMAEHKAELVKWLVGVSFAQASILLAFIKLL